MDDKVQADAGRVLQNLLDAVDRGELTAETFDELELLLRIEGAVGALKESSKE